MSPDEWNRDPIFLIGSPLSGTTIYTLSSGRHPEVAYPDIGTEWILKKPWVLRAEEDRVTSMPGKSILRELVVAPI